MKAQKEAKISYWAAHLTTIVSVTLLLLIIGTIAMLWVAADTETRRMHQNIELSAVLEDSLPQLRQLAIADAIGRSDFVRTSRLVSSKEALEHWKRDTGEDLEAVFGANPLSAEISFRLKDGYTEPRHLKKIKSLVENINGVSEVAMPDIAMIESMNANIRTLSIVLGSIALIMIIISFVLINNTVHLSIYARRFTIHTMQLVGASNSFIRRPFIRANLLSGFIAGVIAALILVGAIMAAVNNGVLSAGWFVEWWMPTAIALALVIVGIGMCAIAAAIATTKYLRKDYDELFK